MNHNKYFCLAAMMIVVIIITGMKCPVYGQDAGMSRELTEFRYGMTLYGEGLYDVAAIEFQHFISSFPNSVHTSKALFLRGECLFELQRWDASLESYLTLLLRFPTSPDAPAAQYRIARCLEEKGNTEEAIESYYRLYHAYPDDETGGRGLVAAGRLAMKEGFLEKAEVYLKLAIDTQTSSEIRSDASYLLASVYEAQGDIDSGISILQSLMNNPVKQSDTFEAACRLGKFFEKLGYYYDSEQYFNRAASPQADRDCRIKAWAGLGRILGKQGQYEAALTEYQKALDTTDETEVMHRCMMEMADIYLRQRQYSQGLRLLERISGMDENHPLFIDLLEKKAALLSGTAAYTDALRIYETLIEKTSNNPVDRTNRNTLLAASLCNRLGYFDQAAVYYRQFLDRTPPDLMHSLVCIRLSGILSQEMKYHEEAMAVLRTLFSDAPDSPFMPEARYQYASILLDMQLWQEAEKRLEEVSLRYPGSEWARKAAEKHARASAMWVDFSSVFPQWIEWSLHGRTRDADSMMLYIEASWQTLKNPALTSALIQQFRQIHGSEDHETVLQYHLGRSYALAYHQQGRPALLDTAMTILGRLVFHEQNHPYRDQAAVVLADLAAGKPARSRLPVYWKMLGTAVKPDLKNRVSVFLASSLMEVDSTEKALSILTSLGNHFTDPSVQETRDYLMARLHLAAGNAQTADSICTDFIIKYKSGFRIPEVWYIKARAAVLSRNEKEAIRSLEKLRHGYEFSVWADSSQMLLGHMYLNNHQYEKAAQCFTGGLERDSILTLAGSLGLIREYQSKRDQWLRGEAEAWTGMGQFKKSKSRFFELLAGYPDRNNRIAVFTALAGIAEEENNPPRALDYLKRIAADAPSDSSYRNLGMLHMRLTRYPEAIHAFDQGITISKNSDMQAFMLSRIIIAMLRQDQIPQSDVRMNLLRQTYKSVDRYQEYLAEITLERGESYFRQKDFEDALSAFEEVASRYKRTSHAPAAEMEIGRVYLVTNHIDKALDILTSMPEKYPDHPVLARVYLNLGDHYFRSQQYDNALSALRRVIQDFPESDVTDVAMRYLIRVYDALRMWDAAMALCRQYIERYPDAEDMMQKRIQIGIFYINLKDFKRGAEYLKSVKKDADPDTEAEIQYWIGKAYFDMGDFEQAIFEYLKVKYISKPTRLPWATTAMYEAGMAYLKLNKPEEAKIVFQKIVESEGATSDLGRIARQRIQEIEGGPGS